MRKKSSSCRVSPQKNRRKPTLGIREKRRLTQLALCVVLFFAIFLGKGIPAERMTWSGEKLLQVIRSDADFKSAFTTLGEAFSNREPVVQTLGELVRGVFGEEGQEEPQPKEFQTRTLDVDLPARYTWSELPTHESILSSLGVILPPEELTESDSDEKPLSVEPEPLPTPEIAVYTGPALPDGATMEYMELDLGNMVTPVMGEITSAYGYRDHPVSGEYLFHKGVDISADFGANIAAFASGTVEYIGESEAYGLYIQLDHGNGIKTFYCHCSELYVQPRTEITAGQTIAAVGDTGNATGAHLHLELKANGILLNPAYYIETKN